MDINKWRQYGCSAAALWLLAAAAQAQQAGPDNPYGLGALWQNGDFVAKGTLLMLVLMSIGSWYVLITKLYDQYLVAQQARGVEPGFWQIDGLERSIASLAQRSSYREVAEAGLASIDNHDALGDYVALNEWVQLSLYRAIEVVQSRLQAGLAVLATVGATAPFIGLFGTVWGIYHALTEIGIAGQASIDKVAGPVGEALIMTALGLAVAVPAVLGYNLLVRRNKALLDQLRWFSGRLHGALLAAAGRRRAR